jgi:protein-tyrosine phosphatase
MNTPMAGEQRVVQVEGAYNVRDLGGYKTKDGLMTRWGVLFRADGLHKLTEESRRVLVGKGVRTVIDLRYVKELEEKQDAFAQSGEVDYHHVSLINSSSAGTTKISSLGDLYINMLDNAQVELLRVFELLGECSDGAVLFHCTAGKDRTGVVAALLLDLAGVPSETIAEDYALTSECLEPIMDELRTGRPPAVPEDVYEQLLGCDPVHMLSMLRHLESRYGNAERYLLGIGLPAEKVQALKEQLVQGCR